MTFRRDLLTWARSEWARRHPLRPADVEALLRPGHVSGRLLPGAVSAQVPQTGVGRPVAALPDQFDLDLLEHGMIIMPQTVVPPLTYHNSEGSQAYLDGVGTPIPDEPNQWLIGARTASWPTDPSPWQPPSWDSVIWTDAGRITQLLAQPRPWRFSGLARLFVQVQVGAGRLLDEAISGADPDSDGLLRVWNPTEATLQYWWIRTTEAGGVTAARGIVASDGLVALGLLNQHEQGTLVYSDIDRRWLETWVLRGMIFDTPVELMNAAGLAQVYADGYKPFAHGWNYARMRIGTALETTAKASCVTEKLFSTGPGDWYARTVHWHLEFTVSGVGLAVALAQQEAGTWAGGNSELVWRWINNQWCYYHGTGVGSLGDGGEAPVYSSWGDTIEHVHRYVTPTESPVADGPGLDALAVCETGTDETETWQNRTSRFGGPYISGTAGNASGPVHLSTRDERWTLTVAETGMESLRDDVGADILAFTNNESMRCNKNFGFENNISGPGDSEVDTGTATEIHQVDQKTLFFSGRAMIITEDPEATYIVEQQRHNSARYVGTWFRDKPAANPAWAYGVRARATIDRAPGTTFRIGFVTQGLGGTHYGTSIGIDYGYGMATMDPTSEQNTNPVLDTVNGWLICGGADRVLSAQYDDWAAFFSRSQDCIAVPADSVVSYHESAGWFRDAPARFALTPPFNPDPADHGYLPSGVI